MHDHIIICRQFYKFNLFNFSSKCIPICWFTTSVLTFCTLLLVCKFYMLMCQLYMLVWYFSWRTANFTCWCAKLNWYMKMCYLKCVVLECKNIAHYFTKFKKLSVLNLQQHITGGLKQHTTFLCASTDAICTSTYHTKQLNPWPNLLASHAVNCSQLSPFQREIEPFKDHLNTRGCLTNLRTWKQPGKLEHQYLPELLVNAYTYCLMMKNVSYCYVCGSQLFSNPATNYDYSYMVLNMV